MATHSSVTNSAKNSSELPRSFWLIITTSDAAHASSTGPRCFGSGREIGPTRRLLTARSSRFSTRYDAKKMARRILANSPGWKLIGPMLTQIRAPKYSRPMPGTSGSSSRPMPRKPIVQR